MDTRVSLELLALALVDAGVDASTDPRSAADVLIMPPSLVTPTMCSVEITASVWVTAPGPYDAPAWDTLDGRVSDVLEVLEAADNGYGWQSMSYQRQFQRDAAGGEAPLPAVEIVLQPFEI